MSGEGKRPFVPPVTIKDDLDKPNASNSPKKEEWHKSIVPSLIIYTAALIFFVILTIVWIATHSGGLMTQLELTNSYLVTALLLVIDGILIYGLFHGMEFMKNKSRRETLVNLSEHQATTEYFTQQMAHIMSMQARFMDVMEERAKKSIYQGVLSVADSHDNEHTETDAHDESIHVGPTKDDKETGFGLEKEL